MAEYTDGIPKRELTLQYQPLGDLADPAETDKDTPSVAGGTEIKLYAETIKEIFQKEPTTVPIQKGQGNHFEGDKTLIVDTLKAKHKFEISAWVYSNKNGKHSLDDSILSSGGEEAQITTSDKLAASEFNQFVPLGDTGIKYDSETLENATQSTTLKKGFRDGVLSVDTTNNVFVVDGDRTGVLANGDDLFVTELASDGTTTGNHGAYTVSSVSYNSTGDETSITVNETVSSTSTDGVLAANDYQMNYSRGEIKFFDTGGIATNTETTEFLGQTINTTTVISDELQITYTFDASAKNIARLIRRMSQLGNPLVMRLDKEDLSLDSSNTVFEDAHDYLVIPKKVSIGTKSEKPDEYKVELELRKGTIEQ